MAVVGRTSACLIQKLPVLAEIRSFFSCFRPFAALPEVTDISVSYSGSSSQAGFVPLLAHRSSSSSSQSTSLTPTRDIVCYGACPFLCLLYSLVFFCNTPGQCHFLGTGCSKKAGTLHSAFYSAIVFLPNHLCCFC